jgi:hypothetical protein
MLVVQFCKIFGKNSIFLVEASVTGVSIAILEGQLLYKEYLRFTQKYVMNCKIHVGWCEDGTK